MTKPLITQNGSSIEITDILKKNHQEFLLNQTLIQATKNGDLSEVQRLVKAGATFHKLSDRKLHLYNSEYDTLLHTAVKQGYIDIVKYLIECDCDINAQTRRGKATPLHYATYLNVPSELLSILLDHGAELEMKDEDHASAFMWASYLNNSNAIKILFDRNADPYTIDYFGLSPLEWASHQGNLESVAFLISAVPYTKAQLTSAYAHAIASGQTVTATLLDKELH